MSSTNEFRKRQGAQVQGMTPGSGHSRSGSASTLPRPGMNGTPRSSPISARRSYSSGTVNQQAPPPYPMQRSTSSNNSGMASSPSLYTSTAFNANNGSHGQQQYGMHANSGATSNGSQNYGGYGSNNNNSSSSNGGYGNGMSSSNSNRYAADDKYSKKPKRKASGPPGGFWIIIGSIVLFVYAVTMTTLYATKHSQTKTLLTKLKQPDTKSVVQKVESLERKLKSSETSRRTAETNARNKVSKELNNLQRERDLALKAEPKIKSQMEKHERRDNAFADQIGWLMDRTRRESKRMVLERFGPGPHKVEITYMVGDEAGENLRYNFVIEMAPLNQVPHAVHLFLEQVDHGLMDGTHFYLNGPHIVQAGPQPKWTDVTDGTDDAFTGDGTKLKQNKISGSATETLDKYDKKSAEAKVEVYDDDEYEWTYSTEEYYEEDKRTKAFQDLGLDSLAFPDYSDDYPHLPWTVGFTGRPGGPDWYINKVNNSKSHGPGGQKHHALEEQGDSCFGTISSDGDGRSSLAKQVFGMDVYGDNSEWHHFLDHPVEIVSATILTKNPILDRHLHLDHITSQHKVYDFRRKAPKDLPESVKVGEGVDRNNLPRGVHDMVDGQQGEFTINKLPPKRHDGHIPHMQGNAEA